MISSNRQLIRAYIFRSHAYTTISFELRVRRNECICIIADYSDRVDPFLYQCARAWLWINIGDHHRKMNIVSQMCCALKAYGADDTTKHDFADKLIQRMNRVLVETDETRTDYNRVKEWIQDSILWVEKNKKNIKNEIG